jgi:hypothetical protein
VDDAHALDGGDEVCQSGEGGAACAHGCG